MGKSREAKKKGQSIWIRIGIGVASLAMIGFTISQFVPNPGDTVPVIAPVSTPTPQSTKQSIPTIGAGTGAPLQLAGMDRTSYTPGVQALADINKLHGTDITVSDGYNAVYSNSFPALKVTVWVGVAGSSANAATLVNQMRDTINQGGAAFTNAQPLSGQNGFQVQGPGGSNYFYQSRLTANDIVWLTIQAPDPTKVDNLLQAALQTF